MSDVPILLSVDQATVILAAGMLLEGARRGDDDVASVRAQVDAITSGLNSPAVDAAVRRALEAYLPADLEGAVAPLELESSSD